MKVFVALACVVLVSSVRCEENEDERLDRLRDSMSVERRALCNTIIASSKASISKAAGNFARTFGRRAVNPCLNTDSCNYKNNIFGRISGISKGLTGGIKGIGSINKGIIFGKRDSQDKFIGKASRDIIFIIDDSGSIPNDQFQVAKRGAVTFANSFCPNKLGKGTGEKQVAVVLFSSSPRTVISFEDSHQGSDWLATKIQGLPQSRGGTATAAALKHVRKNILGKGASRLNDPNTSTHIVMVTDGQCNQGCQDLKEEADALRNMGPGVQLFALGVARARACELEIITGNGKELAFGVADFNSFETFAKAIKDQAKGKNEGCL